MSAVRKLGRTLLFDTLEYVKKLEEAGFPQKQAEAQVRLFSQVLEENICSKQDLLEAEGRLEVNIKETEGRLEVKLKELEVKLKETEGRIEIKFKELEIKLKALEGRLVKWFVGTFLVSMGIMTGVMTLIVKLVHT